MHIQHRKHLACISQHLLRHPFPQISSILKYSDWAYLLVLALGRVLLRARFATFFLVILVRISLLFILIVLIFFIVEISVFSVFLELFKLKSLPSEPVNGARNQFLLDVFPQLVIKLQALLNVRPSIFVVCGRSWRSEEVEEGFGGDGLLDNAGLLGV
jgi:hypothetical protein